MKITPTSQLSNSMRYSKEKNTSYRISPTFKSKVTYSFHETYKATKAGQIPFQKPKISIKDASGSRNDTKLNFSLKGP